MVISKFFFLEVMSMFFKSGYAYTSNLGTRYATINTGKDIWRNWESYRYPGIFLQERIMALYVSWKFRSKGLSRNEEEQLLALSESF